jgi:hypothetical protein
MEMSGYFHGYATEPVWKFWRREKSNAPAGSVTLERPARILMTKEMDIAWFRKYRSKSGLS